MGRPKVKPKEPKGESKRGRSSGSGSNLKDLLPLSKGKGSRGGSRAVVNSTRGRGGRGIGRGKSLSIRGARGGLRGRGSRLTSKTSHGDLEVKTERDSSQLENTELKIEVSNTDSDQNLKHLSNQKSAAEQRKIDRLHQRSSKRLKENQDATVSSDDRNNPIAQEVIKMEGSKVKPKEPKGESKRGRSNSSGSNLKDLLPSKGKGSRGGSRAGVNSTRGRGGRGMGRGKSLSVRGARGGLRGRGSRLTSKTSHGDLEVNTERGSSQLENTELRIEVANTDSDQILKHLSNQKSAAEQREIDRLLQRSSQLLKGNQVAIFSRDDRNNPIAQIPYNEMLCGKYPYHDSSHQVVAMLNREQKESFSSDTTVALMKSTIMDNHKIIRNNKSMVKYNQNLLSDNRKMALCLDSVYKCWTKDREDAVASKQQVVLLQEKQERDARHTKSIWRELDKRTLETEIHYRITDQQHLLRKSFQEKTEKVKAECDEKCKKLEREVISLSKENVHLIKKNEKLIENMEKKKGTLNEKLLSKTKSFGLKKKSKYISSTLAIHAYFEKTLDRLVAEKSVIEEIRGRLMALIRALFKFDPHYDNCFVTKQSQQALKLIFAQLDSEPSVIMQEAINKWQEMFNEENMKVFNVKTDEHCKDNSITNVTGKTKKKMGKSQSDNNISVLKNCELEADSDECVEVETMSDHSLSDKEDSDYLLQNKTCLPSKFSYVPTPNCFTIVNDDSQGSSSINKQDELMFEYGNNEIIEVETGSECFVLEGSPQAQTLSFVPNRQLKSNGDILLSSDDDEIKCISQVEKNQPYLTSDDSNDEICTSSDSPNDDPYSHSEKIDCPVEFYYKILNPQAVRSPKQVDQSQSTSSQLPSNDNLYQVHTSQTDIENLNKEHYLNISGTENQNLDIKTTEEQNDIKGTEEHLDTSGTEEQNLENFREPEKQSLDVKNESKFEIKENFDAKSESKFDANQEHSLDVKNESKFDANQEHSLDVKNESKLDVNQEHRFDVNNESTFEVKDEQIIKMTTSPLPPTPFSEVKSPTKNPIAKSGKISVSVEFAKVKVESETASGSEKTSTAMSKGNFSKDSSPFINRRQSLRSRINSNHTQITAVNAFEPCQRLKLEKQIKEKVNEREKSSIGLTESPSKRERALSSSDADESDLEDINVNDFRFSPDNVKLSGDDPKPVLKPDPEAGMYQVPTKKRISRVKDSGLQKAPRGTLTKPSTLNPMRKGRTATISGIQKTLGSSITEKKSGSPPKKKNKGPVKSRVKNEVPASGLLPVPQATAPVPQAPVPQAPFPLPQISVPQAALFPTDPNGPPVNVNPYMLMQMQMQMMQQFMSQMNTMCSNPPLTSNTGIASENVSQIQLNQQVVPPPGEACPGQTSMPMHPNIMSSINQPAGGTAPAVMTPWYNQGLVLPESGISSQNPNSASTTSKKNTRQRQVKSSKSKPKGLKVKMPKPSRAPLPCSEVSNSDEANSANESASNNNPAKGEQHEDQKSDLAAAATTGKEYNVYRVEVPSVAEGFKRIEEAKAIKRKFSSIDLGDDKTQFTEPSKKSLGDTISSADSGILLEDDLFLSDTSSDESDNQNFDCPKSPAPEICHEKFVDKWTWFITAPEIAANVSRSSARLVKLLTDLSKKDLYLYLDGYKPLKSLLGNLDNLPLDVGVAKVIYQVIFENAEVLELEVHHDERDLPMSEIAQKALIAVQILSKLYKYQNLPSLALEYFSTQIIPSPRYEFKESSENLTTLGRFYGALSRKFNLLYDIKKLIFETLYWKPPHAFALTYGILCLNSDMFSGLPYDQFALTDRAVLFALISPPQFNDAKYFAPVKSLLQQSLEIVTPDLTYEQFVDTLLDEIKGLEEDTILKKASKAISMLCIQAKWIWFDTFIKKRLMDWVRGWRESEITDAIFASFISVIGDVSHDSIVHEDVSGFRELVSTLKKINSDIMDPVLKDAIQTAYAKIETKIIKMQTLKPKKWSYDTKHSNRVIKKKKSKAKKKKGKKIRTAQLALKKRQEEMMKAAAEMFEKE